MNLGFRNFKLIFLKIIRFLVAILFLYLRLSVWVYICIVNVQRWGQECSSFSQWKTYFSKFIDHFLKFENLLEYLSHYVKFEMWPALCNYPILFSKIKLKNIIKRFRTGSLKSYSLVVLSSFSESRNTSESVIFEYQFGMYFQKYFWVH